MAIVDDSQNEVIRKAAEPVTSTDYRLKVRAFGDEGDTIRVARTTVTTAATKINFPDVGNNFNMYVKDGYPKLYIGNSSAITSDGTTTVELPPLMKIPVTIPEGGDVEVYGITNADSIVVYVIGIATE